jgi:membrane protein YqaA with SNARE-associated domain
VRGGSFGAGVGDLEGSRYMIQLLAATFGYCILSALIPVFNAEAYVGGVAAVMGTGGTWAVAAAAAGGQMVGKVLYYLLGRSSVEWRWIKKKTESERWKASFEKWRKRTGGNPWLAGSILLLSAFAGFPPFAIMSVIAGQVRVALPVFVTVGFVGRFARFASILGLVGWFCACT